MCGICGLVGLPEPGSQIPSMLARLTHRGPDHQGTWTGEQAALGHARLSIVDLSPLGNQPMPNEDGSLLLVGNGEIYNSPDLLRELQERGHVFRSHSDNEVLLHLYEEEGDLFPRRLNGMIAAALWDARRSRLLLLRDRLGIKPLYYATLDDGRALAFASEIKALLACDHVAKAVSPRGLGQYLAFANTFGPATLHQGVRMVEPGQTVIWEDGRLSTQRYWKVEFPSPRRISFSEACREYRRTVADSVSRHLMSDVEVASYLSAGFDSTTVATLAQAGLSFPLRTYTGGFGLPGWYDETEGSLAVAQGLAARHEVVTVQAQDLADHLDNLIFALDEPRLGMGAFPQYLVAKAAAASVKVILTGHGGDELFAGYPIFKAVLLARQWRANPLAALGLARRIRPAEAPHLAYFLSPCLGGGLKGPLLPTLFGPKLLAKALTPRALEAVRIHQPRQGLEALLEGETDPYRRLTRVYLGAYLPGLFVVEDKISMAHSLESRTPLCDNAMVDLALSLPLELKMHGMELKAIPKAAMRPDLPPVLYRLPKRGFPTPLAHWLRSPLAPWLRARLCHPDSPLAAIFRPAFMKEFVEGFLASPWARFRPLDEIPAHRIWALLSLEAWLRTSRERLGIALAL